MTAVGVAQWSFQRHGDGGRANVRDSHT
jgi:hypothetical protein